MTSPSTFHPPRAFRTRKEIEANPYPRRGELDSSNADRLLAALPLGHRDWKRILACILVKHGREHGTRNKQVSNQTMYERPRFLYRFFDDLHRQTIYVRLDPRCLGNRHVEAMIAIWAKRGLGAGTIANYLSVLRVFATWIGEDPAIVRSAAEYLGDDSAQAHRRQVADEDHSWIAAGIELAGVLEQIRAICPYVAIQTECSRLFGLRPKEARCLRPHEAVIPRERANPRDRDPNSLATHYLHLDQGTKGGRPRDQPIETEVEWELVRRAQALVRPGQHLGRPGYTLKQNTEHYYRVLRKVGITRDDLGVTAHGLRHEFAIEKYKQTAGVAAPVRGGSAPDREVDRGARGKVSRLLGHARRQVTSAYLGSPRIALSSHKEANQSDGAASSMVCNRPVGTARSTEELTSRHLHHFEDPRDS
ncbi:MAG TPA: integrase domain-containing protein [Burkholderiaceae bacterium]|nr:integrase domain-containing protein [Burkholderiaceae bacterium]